LELVLLNGHHDFESPVVEERNERLSGFESGLDEQESSQLRRRGHNRATAFFLLHGLGGISLTDCRYSLFVELSHFSCSCRGS